MPPGVRDLASRAADLLGPSVAAAGPGDLQALLLHVLETAELSATDAADAAAVLADIVDASFQRIMSRVERRARRIAHCERGLARLRAISSADRLIDSVCNELARSCGFDRVMLSRMSDGEVRPWRVSSATSQENWLQEWERRGVALPESVLESALVPEPGLVADVTDVLTHPIIRDSRTTSFVLAPIPGTDITLGFFHADHGADGPPCDPMDRDIVKMFAEGFARIYERTVLIQRLREQRATVRGLLSDVDGALDELSDAEAALARLPDDGPAMRTALTGFPGEDPLADLTPRERDVLAALASGASNAEIASRLVLTVGTVKTHVKHVLAKLGAANRAHAAALYLNTL
jgi:LuxR family transcriptional regulator, regulator of acetate metabolism